ncbi:hypothetical protein F2A38_12715 [Pseudomonas chlororaphis]|uniref:Uncharacterized protein n=1 Tax=Pseudomonas chlororaphis TaxID=587753 RepID=A0AB34C5S9_9PSED|nr:hypothetical protein [Pseudomonas chlororaphis]KAA5842099.1 hypothetical protein F2A38_12715 [Pseudomonas chlororaphis]
MDFWILLGAVGSVASIIALLLPLQSRFQKLIHVAYGIAIAGFSIVAMWYWLENARIHNVERAASALLGGVRMDYTSLGFTQAALAFLEKNKDLYPDAYARAQKMCEHSNCLALSKSTDEVNLSYALQGLIRGISTLEGGS